jgi:UDP-N-acetyl-2-amino-2-deoxyglucuronate dehydrogenase
MSSNFAILGVGGFVAPRHLKAIRDTGHTLVAACDPHDAVGILDKFSFNVRFFTEYERFDRHLEKLRRGPTDQRVQYLSICSPNYLHDAHVRLALRVGATAICEKPLVIRPWNLDALESLESEYGTRVYTILQLRLHPQLVALRERLLREPAARRHGVELTYVTSRGPWYDISWKGVEERSGGVVTNIGIHFFDMLTYVFGAVRSSTLHLRSAQRAAGYLELERARVRWFLSITNEDLPSNLPPQQKTWRSIHLDGGEFEFSEGFTDLHTESYRSALRGEGYGIEDCRPSIELASNLRTAALEWNAAERHPFARQEMQ